MGELEPRNPAIELDPVDQLSERGRLTDTFRSNFNRFLNGEPEVRLINLNFDRDRHQNITYMLGEHVITLPYEGLDNSHFVKVFEDEKDGDPVFYTEDGDLAKFPNMPHRLNEFVDKRLTTRTDAYKLRSPSNEYRGIYKVRFFDNASPIAEIWLARRFEKLSENIDSPSSGRALIPYVEQAA